MALSGTDAANYTVNDTAVTTADIDPLAIVGSVTAANKTYDGNASATLLTHSLSGVLGGDDVSYAGGTATFVNKNAGVAKTVTATGLGLSGADAANYSVNTAATTTADIDPLAIVGSVTAADKIYDGTVAATLAGTTLSGVIAGDSVSYGGGTATFADRNVGVGKSVTAIGLSLSGADAANYTVNGTATSLADITALALTGGITAANKVYDGNADVTITGTTLSGVIAGDTVSYGGGSAAFADKNAGIAKTVTATGLALSGGDAANYTVNGTATTTADIDPLALVGSVTAADKIYDGDASATLLTHSLSGVLGGDDVSYAGGTATFANKNAGVAKTVTATGLGLSGADAANYSVNTTATTTADIDPLSIVGSVTAANKIYDGDATATLLTRSLSGAITGDDVNYVGGVATYADKNAGVAKTVTATGLALSGVDAGNYTVNSSATTTADIDPLAIAGSVTAANKVYDGDASATLLTRSLSGRARRR